MGLGCFIPIGTKLYEVINHPHMPWIKSLTRKGQIKQKIEDNSNKKEKPLETQPLVTQKIEDNHVKQNSN